MNIYISKVETTHKFTISKDGEEFKVIKPNGKTYTYSYPEEFGMDEFVTDNEANDELSEEEKKDRDDTYLTSELNTSILNGSGYTMFELLLSNINKLIGKNYLFYFQFEDPDDTEEYILMIKNIDTGEEMESIDVDGSAEDEISEVLGAQIVRDDD
jgi:hypothetical protein